MHLKTNYYFLLTPFAILFLLLGISCNHSQEKLIYGSWIIDSVSRKSDIDTDAKIENNLKQNLIGSSMTFFEDNTYKSSINGSSPRENFSITKKGNNTSLIFLNKPPGVHIGSDVLILNGKELLIKIDDGEKEYTLIHFSRKNKTSQ
ncbi:hypothetical protein F0919_01590 [Taibaiella lutea]|uniref:Lipocalin-like domain-containing protein n=1 Tax=Taibaiella lutea TaxID=2608001 RepID=A0A5M6CMX0_9BACT|nr:hypothetical protein [Taibaiella lutea]KAA5536387.1 hypothetical protein F0919_01590 [Taibaiella lutea]